LIERSSTASGRRPTFSVVIAAYNSASVLGRAIRAVLAQTFADFEVIVADDGSTDGTLSSVTALDDSRVTCVPFRHSGPGPARNAGAAYATGEYLVFLDSDDEVMPEWLERMAEVIRSVHPAVVSCGLVQDGEAEGIWLPSVLGADFDHQAGLFVAGAFAVRNDVFRAVGGYANTFLEHTELAFRLMPYCLERRLPIEHVSEPLLRLHRSGAATLEKEQRRYEGARYLLEHHLERIRRNRVSLVNTYAVLGVSAARLGRFEESRRAFLAAARANPRYWKLWTRFLVSLSPIVARSVWGDGNGSARQLARTGRGT